MGAKIPENSVLSEHTFNVTLSNNLGSSTYDSGFGSITSFMSGGGSGGLFFDGLMPYIGNNTYENSTIIDTSVGGIPARLTLTLTSERSAYGSLGFVDGHCTAFVPFTVNYVGG